MFRLCLYCARRQGVAVGSTSSQISIIEDNRSDECYICNGLLFKLDEIFKRMLDALKEYEFNTFLIGCTLPSHMIENEDELRALLKVKGHESIKSSICKELGKMLTSKGYKVDYTRPDIDIHIKVNDANMDVTVNVKARPIYFSAVYTKHVRGLAQKGSRDSIECMVREWLMKELGCEDVRFTWVGGEDSDSLVINGRPFFIKVINAKRVLDYPKGISIDGIDVKILARVNGFPSNVRFLSSVRLYLTCNDKDAVNRVMLLNNLAVRFKERRKNKKGSVKRIYEAKVNSISDDGKIMCIDMLIDGGFMIKRFVDGIDAEPSIKDVIGDVQLMYFDVLDILVKQVINK
jgi:tRNA pseudouridine synthase 10